MKDLQDIIALARHAGTERAALATLVSVDGSSYRRPGASMLVTPDGRRAGGISGGCLERDVERHAREALAEGRPRLVLYDTQSEADLIVGTGLGCGGRLEILVEPIALSTELGPIARWAAALERREALAELIIVGDPAGRAGQAATGHPPHARASAGWRLFLWSHALGDPAWHASAAAGTAIEAASTDSASADTVSTDAASVTASHAKTATGGAQRSGASDSGASPGGASSGGASRAGAPHDGIAQLVEAATRAAREALALGAAARSGPITLETADGAQPAFVRLIAPPVQLLVCGAGDDAMPLVRMAHALGWYVRVIDHRAAFATRDRFPEAALVDVAAAGELPASVRLDARTVAVTMNHNFRADSAWLRTLAALPIPYIGVLGARSRTEKLLRDAGLDALGAPGSPGLRHLYAPAGLDLGSEGADQIALAIVAEIQAVLASRAGTSLRDRPASMPIAATASTPATGPESVAV